jgi:hypothetical protein
MRKYDMSLKETYNVLLEKMKFPFYSHQETEITTAIDTSKITKPENEEFQTLSFNPFGGHTNSNINQAAIFTLNRNEAISKWRGISFLPEVNQAIREISNEAIVYDEIEDPIALNLNDIEMPDEIKAKIHDSFSKILYMLDFSEKGDELFKQWYVDGGLNFEVVYNNARMREGIKRLILLSPFNFVNFIDPDSKEKRYMYSDTGTYNPLRVTDIEKVYYDEQITSINSGEWNIDKRFPVSYLDPAVKVINQLSLIEDTLVIHRITRSVEKRVFKIPTGKLAKPKAEEYMRGLINKYRQKQVYNTDTGTMETKNRSISILEDIWFNTDANGVGPSVEILPGTTQGFATFEDVDYFVNKVYKALNIPVNRRAPDSRTTIGNQIDIEKDELKFFKFVLKLRRKFNNIFIDLLKKDLLSRNVMSLEDWMIIQEKIKFTYSNSNEYSEIKHNQIISMRIDSANSAMGLLDPALISKKYIQSNILMLTDEEIKEIDNQRMAEKNGGEEDELEDSGMDFGGGDFDSGGGDFDKPSGPNGPSGSEEPLEPTADKGSTGTPVPQATTGKP